MIFFDSVQAHSEAKLAGYGVSVKDFMRDKWSQQRMKDINFGRVSFILMEGHDELQVKIDLPRVEVDTPKEQGREIFAVWKPLYDSGMADEYLTDANGYDLMTRNVFH